MKPLRFVLMTLISVLLISCNDTETIVFAEDFESFDVSKYDATKELIFQGNSMLGNFNNETFELTLNNLTRHQMVTVKMDLYIHDSWDGNTTGVNGPDTWTISVGNGKNQFQSIQTSFSNSSCNTTICLLQAFPNVFPYPNDPKSGISRSFPGLCHFNNDPQGTSMYQISYTFIHADETMILRLEDQLIQSNTYTPKCDESWSIDNLTVTLS